jgi:hypothetical protein
LPFGDALVRAGAVVRERPVVRPAPGCASRISRVDGASCLFLQVQRDIDQHPAAAPDTGGIDTGELTALRSG